jgi:hypothetical protein
MQIANFEEKINSRYGKRNPAFKIGDNPYYVFAHSDDDHYMVWLMDHSEFKLHDKKCGYQLDHKVWLIKFEFGNISGRVTWKLIHKGAGRSGEDIYVDTIQREDYQNLDRFVYYLFNTLNGDRRELLR